MRWPFCLADAGSEIQVRHRQGIAFDEVTARFDRITHQGVEDLVCANGVFDGHAQHATLSWVHGGFPQLIRVHFAQTFVSLNSVTLGAFCHQPIKGFLEFLDLLLAFATLNVSTIVQQGAQLRAQRNDGFVVVTAEEVAVEGDVVRQAVGDQFDLWQPHITLTVFTQAGFVHQARLLDGTQAHFVLGQPILHRRVIAQLLQADGRQVDEVLGQLLRVQTRQTLKGLHHHAEIVSQTLQRLTRDTRGFVVQVQAGIFQGRLRHVLFHGVVVFDVLLLLAFLHLVQRRLGDVDVATLDQLRQLTEEEGQQQGTDVRTVDVSIGHDDDVVVAQLLDVVLVAADTATQRGDQRAHFLGRDHLVETGFFHVEDLALQRQDRLGATVTTLLGGTASRVTFHQVQFGKGRVFFLAVRQFARQAGDIQRTFTTGHLTGFTRRFTGTGGVDHLADHQLGFVRVFQQEVREVLAHFLFDCGLHFGRDQLVLGLGAELRIRHLDRNDRGQAFTGIVTGSGDLVLLRQAFRFDVGVQVTGQCGTETHQVSTAVALRNVVGEAQQVLVEAVVPLQGDFHADAVFTLDVEVEHLVDRSLVGVQVFNERSQATFVFEQLFLAAALVLEDDADTGVEEGQFTNPLGQDVPAEVDVLEGQVRRLEVNLGTGGFALADDFHRLLRNTVDVGLLPDLAAAANGQDQFLGQCVHYRNTYTVQTAGYFVGVVVELTAGVQHGHDDLGCGNAFFFVHVYRDATAVIANGDGLIRVDDDADVVAVAGESFVDRVIDHLEHHVVQTAAIVGVTNVHTGTFAYGIQAFQHFNAR